MKKLLFSISLIGSLCASAQITLGLLHEFKFNNSYSNEANTSTFASGAGITFVADRHGNPNSAINITNTSTSATVTGLPYGGFIPSTVSFWAKFNVLTTADSYVYSYGTSSAYNTAVVTSGAIAALGGGGNNTTFTSQSANVWVHFVFVYDGTNSIIYRNGQAIATLARNWTVTNNNNIFKLGANQSGTQALNGALDDVQIFNRALSSGEVSLLYNGKQTVAIYNFDNTYNNIFGTNPFGGATGISFDTDRNGNVNGALKLTNVASQATIPNLPYGGNAPRTVSIWVKYNAFQPHSNYVYSYGANTDYNAGIVNATSVVQLGAGGNHTVTATASTGVWSNYMFIFDGVNSVVYKNGTSIGSLASNWSVLNNSDIFKLGWAGYFNGVVDDLKIYNYAFTSSEVTDFYNCALAAIQAPTNTTAPANLGIFCAGQSTTLTATGNGVLNWTGAGASGIGSTFVTPTLTTTTTFTVTNTETGCISDPSVVTVSVTPSPSFNGTLTSICTGNSATLTATGTQTISWYASPSSTTALATGTVFTTPTLTSNTQYYISTTANGCETSRIAKTITVTPMDAAPMVDLVNTNLSICSGNGTTIYMDNYYYFYPVPTGGTSNSSGSQYGTGALTSNTTVYAQSNGNCKVRTAITVTVNTVPAVVSQTVQNLSCNNSGNGSIALTLNNASSYAYSWSPNVSSTYSATGLAANVYTVNIANGGCVTTQTYNVTQPAGYNVPVNIVFSGTTLGFGSVYIGSPSFQWVNCNNNNAPIAGAITDVFTPTVTGSYALTFGYGTCVNTSTCNIITVNTCTFNINVTLSGSTLSAAQSSATYQWVDCNNSNAAISGATGQAFTPTITGNYAVTITSGSCVATSACTQVNITTTSVIENQLLNAITLQPNPASTQFTLNNVQVGSSLTVMDVTGKVVFTKTLNELNETIETSNLANGIYVVQLQNNGAVAHKKLIISK